MTPHQIYLVQSTWKRVLPIAPQAADLFYARLFELDPSLLPMFPKDLSEQKIKLMQMITVAVNGLERLPEIVSAVQELGRRHVDYGVKNEHYATVGSALLWTLAKGLGEAFTPEVKEAWTQTYLLLSGVMCEAAAEVNAVSGQ